MKYLSLLILLTLYSNAITAQIEGKVIDKSTNEPIVYVNIWVKTQNTGTTTDEKGVFRFEELNDSLMLVFSALGYESKVLIVKDLPKQITLKPIAIELATVTIQAPKFRKKKRTGKIKKKGINFFYASNQQPWRIGKIFPYKEVYETTPFIKGMEMFTVTNAKRSVLIHVLEVSDKPIEEWEILESNLKFAIEKGRKISKFDLSPYQIKVPKSGLMIVVEWLIIDENRHDFEYTTPEDKITKRKGHKYEPSIGTIPTETNEYTWMYRNGTWQKDIRKSIHTVKKYRGKYTALAIELILSD